jgi:Na+-driven multidrug efflux pump
LFFTGGSAIFSVFLPQPHLIEMGKSYLFIFAFCQLFFNLEAVAAAGFKGISRTIPPSFVSITSNSMRPVLAYILSSTSLGLKGVWIALSIGAIFRGLWICIWYVVSVYRKASSKVSTN